MPTCGSCGSGSKKSGSSKKTNPFHMPKSSSMTTSGSRHVMGGAAAFGSPRVKMNFSGKKR